MPEIFPTRIISFSSEDKAFPASNLLKKSSFSKWKSDKGGSKQEAVEFDFGEPVEFSRLDIGNNGSAFIEVLVRRSASSDEPSVLLPSASFMSPVEAKNGTNLNRVRVFSKENLSKSAVVQKWDIVKFVCSQPFNKTTQYGLSFVSFHSPAIVADNVPDKRLESKPTDVSANLLEDDDLTSSPDLQPGSLFLAAKRMSSVEEKKETCPNASVTQKIRAANSNSSSPKTPINTGGPTLSASCSSPGNRVLGHTNPSRQDHPTSHSRNTTAARAQNSITTLGANESTSVSSPDVSSPAGTSKRKRKAASDSGPLQGVVFSLSGYQNPLRGELRDKALSLGASFRQDWTDECTHLICAFKNTPKFNQVKGHGIIVSDKWITRCYDTTSLVDWRPYRVGGAPSPTNLQSADNQRPARASTSRAQNNEDPTSPLSETSSSPTSGKSKRRKRTVAGHHGDDDDEWKPEVDEENETEETDSDQAPEDTPSDDGYPSDPGNQDTDDEIERAISGRKNKRSSVHSTTPGEGALEELPEIFEGKHFFIHNKAIPADEERLLRRLILAFAGNLHAYMHPEVQFVVSRSSWSDEFDEALKENANLVFVRPDWIIACDQEAAWLAFDKFRINP